MAANAISNATLRDGFEDKLKALAPDAVIFGAGASRLPGTSNFALPGVSAENALMALDLDGQRRAGGHEGRGDGQEARSKEQGTGGTGKRTGDERNG